MFRHKAKRYVPTVPPATCRALKYLSENLRRVRIKRGLTQDRLAEMVDLERRHYQRIETGKIPGLRVETVERIADVLKMEAAELMTASREKKRP